MISGIVAATLPAFLASLVECVEALTIVVAVGITRGWRSAFEGSAAGVALLALVVIAGGPLLQRVPLRDVQLVVGGMLVFFGMRWLRKAVLRYAGVVALHDETSIFERERATLARAGSDRAHDLVGFTTAFNAVVLEGLEVVFIVIAVGATAGTLGYASAGALLAAAVVVVAGVVARGPLSRVPENALKFSVGIMLTAFGVFWTGEGLGCPWPGGDVALLGIASVFAIAAVIALALARSAAADRRAR